MNENGEFFLADAIEVIEEVLASGGEFKLYPKGTSMLPLIVQGRDAVVLVRRAGAVPAKKHDIAFYRRKDGQFVLHRVMKAEKDGTFTMCGDNQFQLEKGIEPGQVIGVVRVIYRDGAEVGEKKFSYRLYVFLWSKRYIRRFCRGMQSKLGAIRRKL